MRCAGRERAALTRAAESRRNAFVERAPSAKTFRPGTGRWSSPRADPANSMARWERAGLGRARYFSVGSPAGSVKLGL